MRAFLLEAGQAAALMAAVVGVGLGAAQLETARSSYPPAQVDPAQVEMDESETGTGDPTREGAPQGETMDNWAVIGAFLVIWVGLQVLLPRLGIST